MKDKQMFLKRLQQDSQYQRFIAQPIRAMKKESEDILKDSESSEAQVRYAQGMCKVLDWHEWIFEQNDVQINAIERNKKDQHDARNRKPNYTHGRYCT